MKSVLIATVAALALVACGKKDENVPDQSTATVGTAPASAPASAPATTEPAKTEEAKK